MKHLFVLFAVIATSLTPALAADKADEYLDLRGCTAGGVDALTTCLADQTAACIKALGDDGPIGTAAAACHAEALEQADVFMDGYFAPAAFTVQVMELTLQGIGYTNQEETLRENQRAWEVLRDQTCTLKVSLAARPDGAEIEMKRCKARLTLQRIGNLENELGVYLN